MIKETVLIGQKYKRNNLLKGSWRKKKAKITATMKQSEVVFKRFNDSLQNPMNRLEVYKSDRFEKKSHKIM